MRSSGVTEEFTPTPVISSLGIGVVVISLPDCAKTIAGVGMPCGLGSACA